MSRYSRPLRHSLIAASIVSVLTLGACASKGPPPTAEIESARTSLRSAESAGALNTAPNEFMAARDKLAAAERASRNERYADARRLAE